MREEKQGEAERLRAGKARQVIRVVELLDALGLTQTAAMLDTLATWELGDPSGSFSEPERKGLQDALDCIMRIRKASTERVRAEQNEVAKSIVDAILSTVPRKPAAGKFQPFLPEETWGN